MQRHGNGLLTGIGILLLVAVIFFGIALINAIDNRRFAVEKQLAAIQEAQDQSMFSPVPFMTNAPDTEALKKLQKDLKNVTEELQKMTDQARRQKSVNPDFTQKFIPSLSDSVKRLEVLTQDFQKQLEQKTIPAANVKYYDRKAQSGGRMIKAIATDLGNLNPVTVNEATVSTFWGLANNSLAEYDLEKPGVYEPLLAETWEESADHCTFRIKLRPGILWHDFTDPVTGKEWKNVPVTAHDFKFYIDTVKNPDVDAAPLRGYLNGIKEVRIINDLEFEMVWSEPYFLAKGVTLSLSPLPRHLYHAYEGPFDGKKFNDDNVRNRMIIGCGPYRMVSWERGKQIVFRRFEKYFGRSLGIMPPIRTYAFRVIQHPSTRLQALVSGDIDCNSLTPEQWLNNTGTKPFTDGTIKKFLCPSMSFSYIGLNQKNPLFADRRVRVALSHLINRERLLKDIYHGLATPVSGTFFSGSVAYDKDIKPYPFDPVKAKALLKEAGWTDTDGDGILDKDGKPFKFTLIFPGVNSSYTRMTPILKEDFAAAGVQLEVLALEWSVVIQRMEGRNFDAVMAGWSTPLNSDPYQLWHSKNASTAGSSNFISFSNPEADKLIEELHKTFDDDARTAIYHKFHKLLHEEQPYLFLFSQDNLVAINGRYQNLRIFPLGLEERILWVPRDRQKPVPGM